MPRDLEEFLRDLASLTDLSLAPMSMQDLLEELLERVRTVVQADTAVVLLLEEKSQELVARAARGLEEEVRQGVRVPVGEGFAGTVASNRQPVVLTRIDDTTVVNPLLWEKGLKVMIGVPLLSAGVVIGVLHVGRLEKVVFTRDDVELLLVTAERAAGAIQGRLLKTEVAAAELLERGLQPDPLPTVAGVALAGRYVPATGRSIGGDWYDAFTAPSGKLWLVTGDVAGHGLDAAVTMGRLRTVLRSYALISDGPADLLRLANQQVHTFETTAFATVVCAAATPPYADFAVGSAGHPPPIVAEPCTAARIVSLPVGPPLGALPDAAYDTTQITLGAGAVMLFYTDGLVERRGESIDVGLERLREAVRADPPALVCHEVMSAMIGTRSAEDDIAIFAAQRSAA